MTEDQMFSVPIISTPEAVALALTQAVIRSEGMKIGKGYSDSADRKYILDAYAECLEAVRNPAARPKSALPV